MKSKLKKLKSCVQFNTRRQRFIGLEILLMSAFLIGTSIVNELFLDNYTSVRFILNSDLYFIYSSCMLLLMVILALVFVFLGMYIQIWIYERATKKLTEELKKDPSGILKLIKNGGLND